jgi:uncharacterized iron-regulated membrane protein
MTAAKWNRKLHRWGALVSALPVLVVVLSGLLLQLKKDWTWVQPSTQVGSAQAPSLPFASILEAAKGVPEAEVRSWEDIDRLDVRPVKGVVKVRCVNRWELQLDAATGEVLSSTLRRSDLIESLHDGSWFGGGVKLWVFLPAAVVLAGLWFTGAYLWWLPHAVRRRRRSAA